MEALPDPERCQQGDGGSEDVNMGNCLKAVGVSNQDSRDNFGRFRFLPFTPGNHIGSAHQSNPVTSCCIQPVHTTVVLL